MPTIQSTVSEKERAEYEKRAHETGHTLSSWVRYQLNKIVECEHKEQPGKTTLAPTHVGLCAICGENKAVRPTAVRCSHVFPTGVNWDSVQCKSIFPRRQCGKFRRIKNISD